jgi:hypothetical protein
LEVDEEDEIKDLIKQPLQSRKFLEERTETRGSFLSSFTKLFEREEQDSVKKILGISYE